MAYKFLSIAMSKSSFYSYNCYSNLTKTVRNMSSSSSGLNVGFIGLGNMGNRMATNLIKKVSSLN